MKEELEVKYVSPSFSARLIDNWHQHTQDNKSAKEYVEKFDEFLIRCNTLHKEGETQILSRFRADLRDDLWTELLVGGDELEAAYVLVQDLDFVRTNHTFKSHNYRASVSKLSPSPQSNKSSTQTLSYRNDIKNKSLERDNRNKSLERDNRNKSLESSKVSFTTKCYKCQVYEHLAVSCLSFVRITIIDGTLTKAI